MIPMEARDKVMIFWEYECRRGTPLYLTVDKARVVSQCSVITTP
jgi:hypothetical protein